MHLRGSINVKLLPLLLLVPAVCCANDIYLANTAVGGNTGADCSDALVYTYFNSAGNWSATPTGVQIGPGSTIHLCGTISVAVGSSALIFQGSGTNGNSVTVLFESGAQLTSPAWSSNAINLNSNSYIMVDGGTNGSIVGTANGTGLANDLAAKAIGSGGSTVHDITIRNLSISNIYIFVNGGSTTPGGNSGCIGLTGAGNNLLIYNNTITQCGHVDIGLGSTAGVTTSNWQVYGNDLSQGVWLIDVSPGSGGSIQNVLIHNNKLHDNDQLYDTADVFHADMVFVRAPTSGTSFQSVYVYNNYFYGNQSGHSTGYVFFSYYGTGNSYVFNNLFRPNHAAVSDGWIACEWNGLGNVYVYNNTLDGSIAFQSNSAYERATLVGTAGGTGTPSNVTWENNLQSYVWGSDISASSTLTSDYNVWYSISALNPGFPQQAFIYSPNGGYTCYPNGCSTFKGWVSDLGFDTHGTAANPNLLSTGHIAAGSSAIGLGTNLTSVCNGDANLAPLCSDAAGVARPSMGAWDSGAYQYVAPTLVSIAITPTSTTIPRLGTQQYTAIATWSDTTTTDVTNTATWASTSTGVATINGSGLASGVANGSTTITATQSAITSNSATLNVSSPSGGFFGGSATLSGSAVVH